MGEFWRPELAGIKAARTNAHSLLQAPLARARLLIRLGIANPDILNGGVNLLSAEGPPREDFKM